MAEITLETFRDRVRRLGGFESSGPITNEFLNETINDALGEYADMLDEEWEGYRDTKTSLVTVAGTVTVALPDGFLKARAVDLRDGDRYVPLDLYAISQTYASGTDRAQPRGYMVVGGNLELFPTPDRVYTLQLRYVPAVDVLVDDDDSVEIPNGWEKWPIYTALAVIGDREERDVSQYLAQCANIRARIAAAAKTRNVAGPRYVPFPGEGSGGGSLW